MKVYVLIHDAEGCGRVYAERTSVEEAHALIAERYEAGDYRFASYSYVVVE